MTRPDPTIVELRVDAKRSQAQEPAISGDCASLRDSCETAQALEDANECLRRALAERARAERKLEKALRLEGLGRLSAGLCHEINNPLSFIIGSLDALRELCHENEVSLPGAFRDEVDELVRTVSAGAERISNIVRSVKLFAEPSHAPLEFVDLEDVLRRCTETLCRSLDAHISIELDFGTVSAALGRRTELQQVFTSILENAAQALAKQRRRAAQIRVVLRPGESGRLRVTIADTGPGMDTAHMERIFDPFFTTKPVAQGTGLGLSICHSLVHGMNGTIEVESREGIGTSFTIDLPAVPSRQCRRADSASDATFAPPTAGRERIRVLALDDEPFILQMLARVLRAHDVTTVTSGYDALALCMSHTFDIILSDINMPGVSGQDFYYMLAMARPGEERKIVFITGGTSCQDVKRFLESVPNPRLEKPVTAQQVVALVQEYASDRE